MASGHRRYISKRGAEFKKAVEKACKDLKSFGDSPVELSVVLHPRDARLMDIDNCGKAICDALQGFIYNNDQQVWKITIERGEKIRFGACVVIAKEYIMP
jgi:Holliday junction resolvase RusA-like endonuclease